MKRILSALVALLFVVLQAQSMSYEQARREAFFLTDKMAYELNLTQDQYDAAYEINLDYLMSVSTVDDVFSAYWTRRNLDMSYILLQWQWDAFRAATYFYRPLYWSDGFWHFAIYARYPRRNYFYFSRPTVYISYRGGHSWRSNGGRSYYHAHRDHFRKPAPHGGLRDRWNRGDFGNRHSVGANSRPTVGTPGNTRPGNNNGTVTRPNGNRFGNSRSGGTFKTPTTTRPAGVTSGGTTTARRAASGGTFRGNKSANSAGSKSAQNKAPATTGKAPATSRPARGGSFGGARNNGTFGSNRSSSGTATSRRSTTTGSVRSGSFGTRHSSSSPASRNSGASRGGSFGNRH